MTHNLKYHDLVYRLRGNFGLDKECAFIYSESPACSNSNEPEVLVWGDSFAMHLVQGLLASKDKLKLKQASICAPVFGIGWVGLGTIGAKDCIQGNEQLLAYLKKNQTIKYVVIGSNFTFLAEDLTFIQEDGALFSNKNIAFNYFMETLKVINDLGMTPVIFAPPPQGGFNMGFCVLRALAAEKSAIQCDFEIINITKFQTKIYTSLTSIGQTYKVIWLSDGICPNGMCRAVINNNIISVVSG